MIRASLVLASVFLLSQAGLAAGFDLSLRATTESSPEPLTTNRIAELDPARPNPQLRRWVVQRKVELADWKSRPVAKGLVGVSAGGLSSTSTIYLRAPGPWYDFPSQFPCAEARPDPVYSTPEGARLAADLAAQAWEKILSENRMRLAFLLGKVIAINEKSAFEKADRIVQEWIHRMDQEWRARVDADVLPKVWKSERESAIQAGYCSKNRKGKLSEKMTSPDVWMAQDTPLVEKPSDLKPLARAPSRRWQGFYAVRMDAKVGESDIVGQMLIDSATPRSVVSPDWMKGQGVPPEWVLIPEAQPERVRIAAGEGQSGLGEPLRFDRTLLSGFPLSLSRFLLFNTEIFDEPEFAAPCCSGILGIDLLRRYTVEFQAKPSSAVQLWAVTRFHPAQGYQWVEVREDAHGELSAICSERVKGLAGSKKLCRDPRQSLREASRTIVFDLPHGRVWYSKEELDAPDYRNVSGLALDYEFIKGDRALVVRSIGKTFEARELEKAGLKKGMVVTDIDGVPAIDLDLWEVNRRLAGVYSNTVALKWQTPAGPRSGTLRVSKAIN